MARYLISLLFIISFLEINSFGQEVLSVLNYQKHDYMYFCAREDLSGHSNFAVTLAQHNRNARKYQAALNKLNIR